MPHTWRLLVTQPLSGAENMAVDELLLARAAATGESVFRVYSWSRPTLSFGRHQRTLGAYDPATIAARGLDVVRRPTGGRSLLHHREVTYSVTAPLGDRSLRSAYDDINLLVLDGLRRLGVDAVIQPRGAAHPSPGPTPCFDAPAAGELTVAGRKLVGSAQWRGEGALLQHGSILVRDDQAVIPELSLEPLPAVSPPATLAESMGREPTVTEVADALFDALRASQPGRVAENGGGDALSWLSGRHPDRLFEHEGANLSPNLRNQDALADVANRYRDESWTWRR